MSFAPGYRFHPTPQELVGYYLHHRATMGDQFRCSEIHECVDFYDQEPWLVWDNNGGPTVEVGEPLFLFTIRRKNNPKCKRFQRKAGSGTWSGGTVPNEILDSVTGSLIGRKRDFRYENGDNGAQNNCWLMTEYEINVTDVLVLCTLKKSSRNPPPSTSTSTTTAANVHAKKDNKKRKIISVDDQRTKSLRLTCCDEASTSSVHVPNMENSNDQHQPVEPVVAGRVEPYPEDQPSTSSVYVPNVEDFDLGQQPEEPVVVDQGYLAELYSELFPDLIQGNESAPPIQSSESTLPVEDLLPLAPPIVQDPLSHLESADQSNATNLVSDDQFEDLSYEVNSFMSLLSTEFQEQEQLGYNNFSLINMD